MTTFIVSPGQTSSGLSIGPSDGLVVNGGTAVDTSVFGGGAVVVQGGGIAIDTQVGSGGAEFLYSGGISSNATIDLGGQELVSRGISMSAAVSSGGMLETFAAGGYVGAASGTVLLNGGTLLDGGVASGVDVQGGAFMQVEAGGNADGTEVQAGGTLVIMPGGVASGTDVQSGGEVISADVLIYSGYLNAQNVISYGQRLSGGTISAPLQEVVYSGGSTVGTTVGSGGAQFVYAGGVTSQTVVGSGGYAYVSAGGAAVSTTVQSGGNQAVVGTAEFTEVQAGGIAVLDSGSLAEAMTVNGSAALTYSAVALLTSVGDAGVLTISYGGVASATTVGSGGELTVVGSGSAVQTTVSSGGRVFLLSGATVDQVSVQSGGVLAEAYPDAVISGLTSAAGAQVLISTGILVVEGSNLAAAASGSLSGLDVSSASIYVRAGGSMQQFVTSGSTELISSGGLDSGSVIFGSPEEYYLAAGTETVFSGGLVADDIFESALLYVSSGGIAQGVTLTSSGYGYNGTMDVSSGGFASGAVAAANGFISVSSGAVISETTILSGGREQVLAGAFADGSVISNGGTEALYGNGVSTDIQILAGGTLQLNYQPFNDYEPASASLNAATDVLTVMQDGNASTVQLTGNYAGDSFVASDDYYYGGVQVTVEGTPCYCRGTRILTDRGEVAVEDLQIGDLLMTKTGAARPLRWIGRRSYAGRFAACNRDVLPVVFRAGSLPGGVPARDLYVSPLHAMYLEGVLVPAACLVNAMSIVQAVSIEQVEYFHLELDSHDVIIAEGALSESYLDDDNRGMFHNAAEFQALYPDAKRPPTAYCAPRVSDGELLEDIRRRVNGETGPAPAAVRGRLDLVDRQRVAGWALGEDGAPVELRIVDNGVVIAMVRAGLPRPDVRALVGGDGGCGFDVVLTGGLAPGVRHVIQVQRAGDGAELPGSPWLLDAVPVAGGVSRGWLRGTVEHADRLEVRGWAFEGGQAPVDVQVLDNGVPVGRALANGFRDDLAEISEGHGRYGFVVRFAAPLSPALRHVIEVRRAGDGAALEGSPVVVEAAAAFDTALEQAVARAVAALEGQDQRRVLDFLTAQADRVRQLRADGSGGRAAAARRALVIDADMPRAGRDAGSQAMLSHMQSLRRLGFEVSFVAARQMEAPGGALEAAGVQVCGAPFYGSVEDVLRRQSGRFELVYLHRAEIADAYLALARRWMGRARVVYAVADLHHVRLARQAAVEQRPELVAASRRLRAMEFGAAARADVVVTHSPVEAKLLRAALPRAEVVVAPWEVARLAGRRVGFGRRWGVAFIGGYGHAPNVDAARFLVEEVMPLVWAADAGIGCLLVGGGAPAVVRALGGARVEVLGQVPDLAEVFGRVRLTVAPLRFGAGIKGKVLESWAAGVACALSPVAAEGLEVEAGVIGADAAGLAAVILRLHGDPAANRAAAQAGRAAVRRGYGQGQVDAAMALVAGPRRGTVARAG